ncbi:MAG: DUF1287 domain-containing protein [Pseudomonadales bacterium]
MRWRNTWLCLLLAAPAAHPEPAALPALDARLVQAAIERTRASVRYDGSYHRLEYPGGDVPAAIGVCTDVVVRAYRALDIDLQQRVHEDMRQAFDRYPPHWGLQAPDPNIDHRRVPNLERFLERQGAGLAVSGQASDYRPGDLVSWRLNGRLPHIGIVIDQRVPGTRRYQIVHNIGAGPEVADVLFAHPISGHFRWLPEQDAP